MLSQSQRSNMRPHLTAHLVLCAALIIPAVTPLSGAGEPASRPASRATIPDDSDHFQFRGQPIHPACVMRFSTKLSDSLPTIAALDVEGCTASQEHLATFTVLNGWVRMGLKDGGWFAYRHEGVSPGGTHVLRTQSSGGGT